MNLSGLTSNDQRIVFSKQNPNSKKWILIIDDDEGILGAIKAILENEGYEIATSENSSFLKKLSEGKLPNLILLDLFISGENGKTILKKIKNSELTRKIPVIMLSAYPNVEKEIKEAGAEDFIAKPFDISALLMRVKKYIK